MDKSTGLELSQVDTINRTACDACWYPNQRNSQAYPRKYNCPPNKRDKGTMGTLGKTKTRITYEERTARELLLREYLGNESRSIGEGGNQRREA